MTKRFVVLVIVGSACLGIAYGQQKGQYPLGTNGLGAGIQPAPGFTYSNEAIFYTADRLKGPNGVAIPVQGSYDLDLDQNMFIYTSKYKFLGGTYGAMFDLFIANGSLIAPQIGLTAGGVGITDTYVQPLTLGYHFSRVDLSAAFGMVVPTGRYTRDPQSTQNIGSGYFGYMPSVSSTIYLTKDKRTIVSTIFLYEFHGEKRYTDITPGQTFDMEWAIGRSLPVGKKMFQLGAVGYGQWQTTDNGGAAPDVKNSRYAVAAIGPQVSFLIPKWNTSFYFRYEPEFGATNRVEGTTFAFGGSISFPVVK
jgi:hypothetical protein